MRILVENITKSQSSKTLHDAIITYHCDVKYFFVVGESSGDQIAALVAGQLMANASVDIRAMGGRYLRQVGVNIVRDIKDMQVMGWWDVLSKLPYAYGILSDLKDSISQFDPWRIVLVDYGGFNLRIARWAKSKGYEVIYLVPPKVWASRPKRIQQLRRYCDRIIVVFPFEKKYFEDHRLPVLFFGHPLASQILRAQPDVKFKSDYKLPQKPVLAILPGSRYQEVHYVLPAMIEAAMRIDTHHICVSCADGISRETILGLLKADMQEYITIIPGDPTQLLMHSHIVLVTSGTATLQCALLRKPMIVCYRTSMVNYYIARRLIKVPYISLPNLMLSQPLVPELIQGDCTGPTIYRELIKLLDSAQLTLQLRGFDSIINQLDCPNAISSIATAISE